MAWPWQAGRYSRREMQLLLRMRGVLNVGIVAASRLSIACLLRQDVCMTSLPIVYACSMETKMEGNSPFFLGNEFSDIVDGIEWYVIDVGRVVRVGERKRKELRILCRIFSRGTVYRMLRFPCLLSDIVPRLKLKLGGSEGTTSRWALHYLTHGRGNREAGMTTATEDRVYFEQDRIVGSQSWYQSTL